MNLDRLSDLDFADKRVTVVGLGVEGVDTVRYLASRGAEVTVSDAQPRKRLTARVRQVADLPVRLSLGANDPRTMSDADAVFVSQGVPLDLPGLEDARRGRSSGTPCEMNTASASLIVRGSLPPRERRTGRSAT